jgi:hypothetical protein
MVALHPQQLTEELVDAVGRARQNLECVGTKVENQRIGLLFAPCTRIPDSNLAGRSGARVLDQYLEI